MSGSVKGMFLKIMEWRGRSRESQEFATGKGWEREWLEKDEWRGQSVADEMVGT